MRAVVQRTNYAYVTSEGKESGRTGPGLMVLLGVSRDDTEADAQYMADKICHLRIFEDEGGKLNRSLLDISGEMLVVSQFTLYGDVRHGRRPGFTEAAAPDQANGLYEQFIALVRQMGIHTETGVFRTEMVVTLANDGPVTILVDSKKTF